MGLDTFAARSPERDLTDDDLAAFEEASPDLTGGMYSGGSESLRGKVYEPVVRLVTGISLYERWIEPDTVRWMSECFERCDPEHVAAESAEHWRSVSAHEVVELGRFLRICAERGLGLVGWW